MCLNRPVFTLPNTLSFRMTLWYALAFVVVLSLSLLVSYYAIDSILLHRMDDDLREDIEEYALLLENEGIPRVVEEVKREVKTGDADQLFIRLLSDDGESLYSSDVRYWQELADRASPFLYENAQPAAQQTELILETLSFEHKEFPARFVQARIGPGTFLQIAESMQETNELMASLSWVMLVVFFVASPVACGIGWYMVRRAVSGVEEVTRAAVDIKNGNLDRRVLMAGQRDEVQTLADIFNDMADRIRRLIDEMREMTDNIAHDLRSPLARIRVIAESSLAQTTDREDQDSTLAAILEQTERLLHLINTTLDVAEVEAGVAHVEKEPVDMVQITEDACELFEAVAEQKAIRLSVSLPETCRLPGYKQNLQRMLVNVLDNAMKYTASGGKVSVAMNTDGHDDTPRKINITVADTGIGIPEAEWERVFERFYRCDRSRSHAGCGLGLSFSRAVARMHGGDIDLVSVPEQSSCFRIVLPVS